MSPRRPGPRLQSAVAGTTLLGLDLPSHIETLIARTVPAEVRFRMASDLSEVERLATSERGLVLAYALPPSSAASATGTTCLEQTLRVHEALRLRLSALPAAALCTSGVIDSQLVHSLRAVPHVQLVTLDAPYPQRMLWSALEKLLSASVTAALVHAIGHMPPLLHHTMMLALCGVGRGMKVSHLASECQLPERTLRRRLCDENPSMTPQAVIGWTRILLAAWHMRDGARPLVDIANVLGFSAASNLHRSVKEYTGLSVQTLRAGDPVRAVVAQFRAAMGASSTRPEGAAPNSLGQPHATHIAGPHYDGHLYPRPPHRPTRFRVRVTATRHEGGEEGTHPRRLA